MNPEMRPAEDELSRAGTQDVDLAKTHTLTDEQRLAQLGHQQELRRTFSPHEHNETRGRRHVASRGIGPLAVVA